MKSNSEIILYQSDNSVQLEVRMEDETVWLTQAQMAILFETSKQNISLHINNIYKEEELLKQSTIKESLTVQNEGNRIINRKLDFYNLDVIISVGYRVKSKRGTQFRIWANQILKNYLLKGYAVNQRIENLEKRVSSAEDKIDFFVKMGLPPVQGIFFDGQIFDAYKFISDLVKSAKKSIVLIDNYVDESVLHLLSKRNHNVNCIIYTAKVNHQFKLDLEKHNSQYSTIDVKEFSKSHDRFLILDDEIVYHIGASLKDLGKKWFAFSKINLDAKELLIKFP